MDFDERKRKQPEAFSHWILSNPDPRTGWELDKPQKYVSVRRKFYSRGDRNRHLDIYIKKAALKASRSIVCLESRIGEEELFQCTGTVMESHKNFSIILTSASLLRSSNVKKSENSEAKDIKIVVHLPDGKSIDGQVEGFDLHFNVAAIRIGESLPAASFTHVNDAMSVDPSEVHPSVLFHLPPYHSRSFNLIQGDQVIALGRFTVQPYELMAAPGEYCSIDRCDFDDGFNCKELFKATCRITRCGIGGPLINRSAEVIGICFYDFSYTAFLPINVATLWWEHFKKYG